jgi:hypothetical protein
METGVKMDGAVWEKSMGPSTLGGGGCGEEWGDWADLSYTLRVCAT